MCKHVTQHPTFYLIIYFFFICNEYCYSSLLTFDIFIVYVFPFIYFQSFCASLYLQCFPYNLWSDFTRPIYFLALTIHNYGQCSPWSRLGNGFTRPLCSIVATYYESIITSKEKKNACRVSSFIDNTCFCLPA